MSQRSSKSITCYYSFAEEPQDVWQDINGQQKQAEPYVLQCEAIQKKYGDEDDPHHKCQEVVLDYHDERLYHKYENGKGKSDLKGWIGPFYEYLAGILLEVGEVDVSLLPLILYSTASMAFF